MSWAPEIKLNEEGKIEIESSLDRLINSVFTAPKSICDYLSELEKKRTDMYKNFEDTEVNMFTCEYCTILGVTMITDLAVLGTMFKGKDATMDCFCKCAEVVLPYAGATILAYSAGCLAYYALDRLGSI